MECIKMEAFVNRQSYPTCLLLACDVVKSKLRIDAQLSDHTSLTIASDQTLTSSSSILRYLARLVPDLHLYGQNILQRTEVDHWLQFTSDSLQCNVELSNALSYLDRVLSADSAFLVGQTLTIADLAVWGTLRDSAEFQSLLLADKCSSKNVVQYYNSLLKRTEFSAVDSVSPITTPLTTADEDSTQRGRKERKEEGKFVELPGAEMGKVVVRFPPEASGFLHIGHAKAALLNQYYQQSFNGKLIMRFDDTNPEKENVHFEQVILEDIKLLGLKPDVFTFTSDHFELLLTLCTRMITEGKAYVDDTEPELMKKEREERTESKNRNNSVEKNLSMWEEMKSGTEFGQKCCVRAKLDMKSDNGCLRDPTMYRCKPETHARTGNKYKTYPTYDFACPIVDSVEGVTHALRTMEYHDRDEQYFWFLKALGLREPYLWEYSRLNLQNTVMSKRKLTWFVESGLVEGWDDPRFPTVRGVMRRGMTVEGLKEFVIAQGSSRSINMMDWDKIWSFNKKVIDPVVPRYTALLKTGLVPVHVVDAVSECKDVQKHPKDVSVGFKKVWYSSKVLVEGADAAEFTVGENVTFINWGNLRIKSIEKSGDGTVKSVVAELNLDDKDYKKTQKITWLSEDVGSGSELTPVTCVLFDHIISKAVLGRDEDFKQYINQNSRVEQSLIGDPDLSSLQKGDIIQLQRRGFYICDSPYQPTSRYSGRESPCVLFNIPDGHSKEMPTTGSKHKTKDNQSSAKEKAQSEKGKLSEKSPQSEISPGGSAFSHGSVDNKAELINQSINQQGDKIRQMKADQVDKAAVEKEVKLLLKLKEDYKAATGQAWKPSTQPQAAGPASKTAEAVVKPAAVAAEPAAATTGGTAAELSAKITEQGNKVRDLKTAKAAKNVIDTEVKLLLQLKKDFQSVTGMEWKPDQAATAASTQTAAAAAVTPATTAATATAASTAGGGAAADLSAQIAAQGNVVRDLKTNKADKAAVDAQVKILLALKADYKNLTGKEYTPTPTQTDTNTQTKQDKQTKQEKEKKNKRENEESKVEDHGTDSTAAAASAGREVKKVTRLGMEVKKSENFAEWYSQVITKAEMIEYYDVSGCYVLRPWAFGIWESISKWFDAEIKKIGFQNSYFPMFVSQSALETEKEHVEDFAPEVAWVTKSGDTQLSEPIAIRPTSETVMYPSYAKWVQSHRDLPIKINQWCNVVRWEFKHPQPFLRTREFLWQEGHSAYATYEEAEKEVYYIIDLYEYIYEQMLAIPVIKGKKTQKEKFAGGDYTTTVEAYISATGRGIQAATSHHLGQNFSKMFNISFEDAVTRERRFAYQNSWAITTRSIGIITMVHGDDKGLVLPPRIAQIQVVIVPCGVTTQLSESEKEELMKSCEELSKVLQSGGVKVRADYRDNYSPGWKFNHWELKGVPVRVEIGPRDVQKGEFVAVRRDTGDKVTLKQSGALASLKQLLDDIHTSMFNRVKKELDESVALCSEFDEFCSSLDKIKLILAPFCGAIKCEELIKKLSARDSVTEEGAPAMGAKGLCIPFKQPAEIKSTDKCVCPGCDVKPLYYTLFGRSY